MKKTLAISLIAGTIVTVAVNASAFTSPDTTNACWDVYSADGDLISRVIEKGANPDDCTPGIGCFETLEVESDEPDTLIVPMGADPATACIDIAPTTTTNTVDVTAEWLEVDPGEGSLNGARRIVVVDPYPDALGVCFTLNGESNRCDATGRNEGSEFHFYPTPDLVPGDELVATWTSDGVAYQSTHVVAGGPTTTAPPTTQPPTTTAPPATQPPTTPVPPTQPPTTTAPPVTTAPPATQPPTTPVPPTQPPTTTAPPATQPPTTPVPPTQPPTTEPVAESAEWLEVQAGQGSLNGARRVVVVEPYPDATGVCFTYNGTPNRCDATGRNEGSEFHFYPTPNLVGGDELVATWTSDGVDYEASYVVPGTPPPPPAPATDNGTPTPSGDNVFIERFESPNSLDNWDAIVVNGQAWNHRPTSWKADHDAGCGGPGTTRTINWPVLNNNIPDVRPVGDTLYWCAPKGPGSGHIMTSFLTGGYAHIDFTPKRTFSNVNRVCWDQNVTNLGNRKWTQVTIISNSDFEAVTPRLDWTRPDKNRPNGPADWGLDLVNGGFMFSTTLGDAQTYTSGMPSDRGNLSDPTVSDKAKRVTTCLEDIGNGRVMVEQERYNGTIVRTPLTGKFPDGEVKVVFQDVSYNPNKAETAPLVSNAYTWHWDDIIIVEG